MSQTNPGEFCPFPYEMLAVMIFVIIETRNEQPIPFDLLNKKKEQGTEKELPDCKDGASSATTVQKIGTAGSVDEAGAEKAVNKAVTDTDGAANITNVIITADTAGAVDTNAVSDAVAVNDAIVANDAPTPATTLILTTMIPTTIMISALAVQSIPLQQTPKKVRRGNGLYEKIYSLQL